uniref:Lipocalin n=1 Tax=Rhipicephalus appendiculatus TaxID=34631 RepID=A0A131YVP9_RHIAP
MQAIVAYLIDLLLLCVLLLADHTCSAPWGDDSAYEFPEPINVTEFLDTSNNIWTYLTTANDSWKCKVDKKVFMNRTHILFDRKYRTDSTIVTHNMQGEFTGSLLPYYDSMKVGFRGSSPITGIEELIYQGKDNYCGVFELRNVTRVITGPCYYLYNRPCWQYRAFDIRVKGFGGRVSAQECLKWFNDTYPEETFRRVLYETSCNSLVRWNMLSPKIQ